MEKIQIITIELKDNRQLHLIDEQDVEIYNKIRDFIDKQPATLIETVERFRKYLIRWRRKFVAQNKLFFIIFKHFYIKLDNILLKGL